jgi:hypothetical protein
MGSQAVLAEEPLKSKLLNIRIDLTYPNINQHNTTTDTYHVNHMLDCRLMHIEMRIEM